jgi:hypothetical protein
MPESELETAARTNSECQSIVTARERLASEIRAGAEPQSPAVAGKHLRRHGQLWKQTPAAVNEKATIPYSLTMVFAHLHNLKVCADKAIVCNRSYAGDASSNRVACHPLRSMMLSFWWITPMSEGCKQKVMFLYY